MNLEVTKRFFLESSHRLCESFHVFKLSQGILKIPIHETPLNLNQGKPLNLLSCNILYQSQTNSKNELRSKTPKDRKKGLVFAATENSLNEIRNSC